ncbi:unnamed protein product [marine sediment metagenome]|uniref:Uncharacterized protein n=1 Tax=marine sediment metagenome TaxID=412755 RepID=X0UYN4_9ZZZZ
MRTTEKYKTLLEFVDEDLPLSSEDAATYVQDFEPDCEKNLDLGLQEKCLIDLFLTLRVTGASMKTFDQMIKWYNKWTSESNKLTLSHHTF